MAAARRTASPFGFVLVAMCFWLPFLAIEDASREFRYSLTYLGTDLTIGGEPAPHLEELLWDESRQQDTMQDVSHAWPLFRDFLNLPSLHVRGQPAFVVAALLVLLGMLAGLLGRTRAVTGAIAGFAGAGALALGQPLARAQLSGPGSEPPFVVGTGFWLALGMLVLLGAANAVAAVAASKGRRAPAHVTA